MDKLGVLLDEARRELSSTEARIGQLLDRASEIAAVAVQEQAELQRFLEEFALEPTVYNRQPRIDRGTGPLFDIEAMRAGAQDLAVEVSRSVALRGNLTAVVQMIQLGQDHLSQDHAFHSVQETADIRLQQAMNSAREDERRRLAREIHDGPAQVLTNAIYAIRIAEQVARRAPDQVAEELTRVRELLKDGVSEIRRFMFDLRPTMLQDHGLAPTLRRYVEDYNRFFAKRIQLKVDEPLPPLTPEQELTIFRIVQEALQNVHKHAGVEASASITLTYEGSWLHLRIADSGRGFDPTSVVSPPGSGAGLPGMRERAKLAGADLTVTSAVGTGTVIQLRMRLRSHTGTLGTATLQ
ncbi:MAG TPA: sensor histidine kinase [Thermomicrobiales bacterium]|nr:sensor histidine kinase [Thermomicrobiales bacterium]